VPQTSPKPVPGMRFELGSRPVIVMLRAHEPVPKRLSQTFPSPQALQDETPELSPT
jgi:hypothetical protein